MVGCFVWAVNLTDFVVVIVACVIVVFCRKVIKPWTKETYLAQHKVKEQTNKQTNKQTKKKKKAKNLKRINEQESRQTDKQTKAATTIVRFQQKDESSMWPSVASLCSDGR